MVLCLELYNDRSTLERFTKLLSPFFSLGPWIYRALMCRKLEIMKGNSSMAVNWWYWCELEVSYMVFAVLYHALSNLSFLWFFFPVHHSNPCSNDKTRKHEGPCFPVEITKGYLYLQFCNRNAAWHYHICSTAFHKDMVSPCLPNISVKFRE